MKSPFSVGVQARPSTFLQSRRKRFSTSAASVKRAGLAETAIGSINRPVLTCCPGCLGSGVWQAAQAFASPLPPWCGPV